MIRSILKVLKTDALKYSPASGVDMVKLINQWYEELNKTPSTDSKSAKAFRSLIAVVSQLGNLPNALPNQLASQFLIKALSHSANAPKNHCQLDRLFQFLEAFNMVPELKI